MQPIVPIHKKGSNGISHSLLQGYREGKDDVDCKMMQTLVVDSSAVNDQLAFLSQSQQRHLYSVQSLYKLDGCNRNPFVLRLLLAQGENFLHLRGHGNLKGHTQKHKTVNQDQLP